ncbi:hypothetical protein DE146DRAFT_755583 [Phaeosphaeria sp. MPI-PUGE-AT-0046c]|nr:hypothetical protein DE146DRAFT_755583 [Phaeosphaeria sp. MPI-PUGE-AT-0046c]
MSRLDSLVEELLYDILEYVHYSSNSSNNLFNLLTVASKYHRIAKDILYTAPRLLKPEPNAKAGWNDRRAHQLVGFLKRLLEEPHLAKWVRKLELCIIFDSSARHSACTETDCPDTSHWPTWDTYSALVDELNFGPKSAVGLSSLRAAYSRHLATGFEPATASLILALVPSLQCLTINSYYHRFKKRARRNFPPTSIHFRDWYGQGAIEDPGTIIGLDNIISLKTTGMIYWSWMRKPKIRFLEICMPMSGRAGLHVELSPANAEISPNITTLIVCATYPWWDESPSRYLRVLTQGLTFLTRLQLRIVDRLKSLEGRGGYEYAVKQIQAPGLQTLVLDARLIEYSIGSFDDGNIAPAEATPIASLTKFPDLRRIVGPMEAFMPKPGRKPCDFPPSIESIEIINSLGERFPDFVQTLADNDDLPNLKSILLWENGEDEQRCEDSDVPKEVREWSRRRGIFIGSGRGELGLSQG